MSNIDLADVDKLNKFQRFYYDYARFHRNPVNVLIHILFVPILTFTMYKMVSYASLNFFNLSFNLIYILALFVYPMYIYVDLFTGFVTALVYTILDLSTSSTNFEYLGLNHINFMLIVHLISWIAQFISHAVFEKRKPAIIENIFLLFNAPVFVFIEIFEFLFGYRKDEISEALRYVDAEIAAYRKKN